MSQPIVIQKSLGDLEIARIRDLRYEILRKPLGMPMTGTIFPGDGNPSTIHLLAFFEADLVGCATFLSDDSDAIQLRGMAVARPWQRRGIGQSIVESAKDIATSKAKTLWCNARFSAIGFYESQGWIKSGTFFDVPIIGAHIVMKWPGNSKNED